MESFDRVAMKISLNNKLRGTGHVYLLLGLFISCTHPPQLLDELPSVCYTTELLPLLQTSCGISGCHATSGHETSFGTDSYSSILSIVEPGDARNSKLYRVVSDITTEEMMPPGKPLTRAQRTTIMVWIEQGASNVSCDEDTSQFDHSICFSRDIQPLLFSSCANTGCHNAASAREGIVLTDYNSILGSEEIVVPYQPNRSELYTVLSQGGEDRMPPSPLPPMSDSDKELIRSWITEGARNTTCSDAACDTLNDISYTTIISPLIHHYCGGCHSSTSASGGVVLDNYPSLSGIALTTENNQSLLVGVVRKLPGYRAMPPSGELSECNIRKIELWIQQGTQQN